MMSSSLDDLTVHRITADLSAFKGKEAILRERPLIGLVCLQDISVERDRLTVGGIVIRTPGLWSLPKGQWRVDSVWEFVSLQRSCWSSAFVRWHLYFDLEVIHTVKTLAAQLPDLDTEWESFDNEQKRNNFFTDYNGPLWQHYITLAPALDRTDLPGNRRDRIFP